MTNNNDFKKLLEESLRPLHHNLDEVRKDLKGVKETQKDHTSRLGALAGDTEQLLDDVKGIRDEIGLWHGRDKREIDEIKKHLNLPIIPDRPQ